MAPINPINYVTYDETGKLTGAYFQPVVSAHSENHIEVTEDQRRNWTMYCANDERDGLEFAPVVAPPVLVPASVTRRQAIQQLRIEGFTEEAIADTISGYIPEGIDRDLALIEFRTSTVFERNRSLVTAIGALLNKNSAQLDQMFIDAAALP